MKTGRLEGAFSYAKILADENKKLRRMLRAACSSLECHQPMSMASGEVQKWRKNDLKNKRIKMCTTWPNCSCIGRAPQKDCNDAMYKRWAY